MAKRKPFWLRSLLVADQAFNVWFFNGDEDETISSNCYRNRHVWRYKKLMQIIDYIFLKCFKQKDHCMNSFEKYIGLDT